MQAAMHRAWWITGLWLSPPHCSIVQAAQCHANASKVSAEADIHQGGCPASQKVNAGVTGRWTKTADGQKNAMPTHVK